MQVYLHLPAKKRRRRSLRVRMRVSSRHKENPSHPGNCVLLEHDDLHTRWEAPTGTQRRHNGEPGGADVGASFWVVSTWIACDSAGQASTCRLTVDVEVLLAKMTVTRITNVLRETSATVTAFASTFGTTATLTISSAVSHLIVSSDPPYSFE